MGLIDRERLTCIGVVTQAHGIKGELRVNPFTDSLRYYEDVESVILETKQGLAAFPVTRMRAAAGYWILALGGVAGREGAEALKGAAVLLEDSRLRPLAPGEYFQHDLIGCMVETLSGEAVGRIEEVMETGANDVLVVSRSGGGVMVPMIASVVKAVDVAAKKVRIEPMPGLLEPEEKR